MTPSHSSCQTSQSFWILVLHHLYYLHQSLFETVGEEASSSKWSSHTHTRLRKRILWLFQHEDWHTKSDVWKWEMTAWVLPEINVTSCASSLDWVFEHQVFLRLWKYAWGHVHRSFCWLQILPLQDQHLDIFSVLSWWFAWSSKLRVTRGHTQVSQLITFKATQMLWKNRAWISTKTSIKLEQTILFVHIRIQANLAITSCVFALIDSFFILCRCVYSNTFFQSLSSTIYLCLIAFRRHQTSNTNNLHPIAW